MALILQLVALCAVVLLLKYGLKYPKNVWVLFATQPLWLCISPTITFIGGILAQKLSPDPAYATLPLSLMIIGLALTTFLVAKLNQHFGRKITTNIGFIIGIVGCLLAMCSALYGEFMLLTLASFVLGGSLAFTQQLRFAALESVSLAEGPRVLSVLMLAGIFAAFIGPEIAVMGKDWLQSEHGFAGSFLGLAALLVLAMVIFQGFANPVSEHKNQSQQTPRPLMSILTQPILIVALLSAAIGYGLMSFLMTATPLSMHSMSGHSLEDTKWVIQCHIVAMFLPSLFTGRLIERIGSAKVLLLGTLLFFIVTIVALNGQQVMHYWWALVLLGISWNFLFTTGTVLLPRSYQESERYKVQALNDFSIFTLQALASLLSGWVLFNSSWQVLIYTTMPFMALMFLVSGYHYQNLKRSHVG
ncbi:MFS transporter [Thalassotalea aquiviva]|uniref:MFS transporter n=1 Tax=Thalassotalea aquiviva TaxID=3242415 RepID=UPI00352BB67B